MKKFILVLTTVPDQKKGLEIARTLVEERLAACVTISPACQSVYWWEDRMAEDAEYVLHIKTNAALYAKLEKRIKRIHPYQIPEIIALPIQKGSAEYLGWIDEETEDRG